MRIHLFSIGRRGWNEKRKSNNADDPTGPSVSSQFSPHLATPYGGRWVAEDSRFHKTSTDAASRIVSAWRRGIFRAFSSPLLISILTRFHLKAKCPVNLSILPHTQHTTTAAGVLFESDLLPPWIDATHRRSRAWRESISRKRKLLMISPTSCWKQRRVENSFT